MSLSNALIYNERLVCGNEEVASGRLRLPNLPPPLAPPPFLLTIGLGAVRGEDSDGDKGWMAKAVNPDYPVVFLNTDRCSDAMETIIGDYICNEFEAKLVRRLVQTLIEVHLYTYTRVHVCVL